MPNFTSYIICGSPRSGSTLLCEMLTASGVAGRPNSYFRQPSFRYWAERWGVATENGTDDADFDQRYLIAMLEAGRSDNGIFGLRLMWSSVCEATRRLQRIQGGELDLTVQGAKAFGPTLYIHLSREDKLAQAISLSRAEQTGLWHLNADGTVYEGDAEIRPAVYDRARIAELLKERESDDAAWNAFFAGHAIEPLRLTYGAVTADPKAATAKVLGALGQDAALAASLPVPTRKMADETSRA
jgi:trehalose 2-sulfotransferase